MFPMVQSTLTARRDAARKQQQDKVLGEMRQQLLDSAGITGFLSFLRLPFWELGRAFVGEIS